MATSNPYAEWTIVPRIAIRLPLELPKPPGFDPEKPETWPEVAGRLELVEGRLEFMPPCGERQQRTIVDVLTELNVWSRGTSGFVVGGNEAGMKLGADTRAADGAVWRWTGQPASSGFAREPPILAVEVAGQDEQPGALVDKARWYLDHGVEVVWVVDPELRRVLVITKGATLELDEGGRLPQHPSLPGLEPRVADFFRQL